MKTKRKKKYKFSISHKLFFITFSLIFGVMSATIIIHTLFFEKFYLQQKTNTMISEVNKFKVLYSYQINDSYSLDKALASFEAQNNSRIAIFSPDGKVKILPYYEKGIDDYKSLTAFCTELIENTDLIVDCLKNDKTTATLFMNGNQQKIGIVSPLSLTNKNDSIIVSVSSVQPISEAASVMLDFYKNIMISFLIVGVFLAFIYAKLISIPLIKINNVAEKMSRLNFNETCEVSTNDELGNLASTLNFLSRKLKKSLEDLKDKNKTLEKEIEIERKTEKLRKDFITGVSHELKTPIGIIEGYAEGLKEGIVKGKEADIYLETILDEAKKMSNLVSNMLELSKLESGTVKLNYESFNILRMIQSQIKLQSLNLEKKNLTVHISDEFSYIYVLGDIFNIQLVISNLIINAIKYTPSNNYINVFFNDIDNKYEICIENIGAHIDDAELNNIFAKFYRIDKSRNRDERSNGLGLSVVKNILELHKSDYNINNTKDGVIFKFTLKKSKDCI